MQIMERFSSDFHKVLLLTSAMMPQLEGLIEVNSHEEET